MRALALLLICTPLLAIEQAGEKVTLSDEDRATLVRCSAEGGCKVWTRDEIIALLLIYHRQIVESGSGCRRNLI